jgi:drug/metabolite transporter (DMT)-like permease
MPVSNLLSPRALGVFQLALSAACFGAMAVFAKFAYQDGVDVVALLLLRFGLAGLLMAALMRLRRMPWPGGRELALLCAMGGCAYVAQSYSFFSALHFASAALVALLLYLHPFIVMLASAAIYRTALTPTRIGCLVAAMGGTALVIGADLTGQPQGYAFGLAAALIYSVYLLIGQRAVRDTEPMAAATVVMLAAAAVFALIALIERPAFPGTAGAWGAVVGIALISTAASMSLLFAGIRRLGAADASVISTLEPVVTAALAAAWLDEQLAGLQLAGGALVLAAVVILARHR